MSFYDSYEARLCSAPVHPLSVTNKTQNKIIELTLAERVRQNQKWGEQNHPADKWGMIIAEEFGEMCQAINEFGFHPNIGTEDKVITEAIQTMASCMAMIECIYRNRNKVD